MIEILRKMFEGDPEKSAIVLKGKCSDCRCETIINITATSVGFGINGGTLLGYSSNTYVIKCSDCYKVNPKIQYPNITKNDNVHYVV
jgi:hypothetical protein